MSRRPGYKLYTYSISWTPRGQKTVLLLLEEEFCKVRISMISLSIAWNVLSRRSALSIRSWSCSDPELFNIACFSKHTSPTASESRMSCPGDVYCTAPSSTMLYMSRQCLMKQAISISKESNCSCVWGSCCKLSHPVRQCKELLMSRRSSLSCCICLYASNTGTMRSSMDFRIKKKEQTCRVLLYMQLLSFIIPLW